MQRFALRGIVDRRRGHIFVVGVFCCFAFLLSSSFVTGLAKKKNTATAMVRKFIAALTKEPT